MHLPLSLLAALGLAAAARPANPGPLVDAHTKVTWGTVQVVDRHLGEDTTRVVLATPTGPRTFSFPTDRVQLRRADGRLTGYAEALEPGDQVKAFFTLGPRGEGQAVEFVLQPKR